MASPVYKFFRVRFKDAFHALTQEDQQKLFAQDQENLQQVGGKTVVICASGWANEEWPYWGVEEYPDIEAVQHLQSLHEESGWFRYMDAETTLGTSFEMPS